MGFELTTLVVIGTDCIGSCKSNYHTITTVTTPRMFCRPDTRTCNYRGMSVIGHLKELCQRKIVVGMYIFVFIFLIPVCQIYQLVTDHDCLMKIICFCTSRFLA